MDDWTQDLQVIAATREYDWRRAQWVKIVHADGLLRGGCSEEQDIAFIRMRASDRAYEWARDDAIHNVMSNIG
jgi:hypothetical protein